MRRAQGQGGGTVGEQQRGVSVAQTRQQGNSADGLMLGRAGWRSGKPSWVGFGVEAGFWLKPSEEIEIPLHFPNLFINRQFF
jgi:hypothetical protein